MSVTDAYFDELFQHTDDPWAFRQRWYERRKRALTLATLPREHYRSIFEPGCANGELSAALAERCDRFLGCDTSSRAVDLARQRLQGVAHATIMQGRLPQDWPEGPFDLIVLSELGYYLDEQDLQRLINCALASLSDDGQLLACHWRPAIEGCPLEAGQVHDLLEKHLSLHRVCSHREPDFLLDVFSRDALSVAQKEFDDDRRAHPGSQ